MWVLQPMVGDGSATLDAEPAYRRERGGGAIQEIHFQVVPKLQVQRLIAAVIWQCMEALKKPNVTKI